MKFLGESVKLRLNFLIRHHAILLVYVKSCKKAFSSHRADIDHSPRRCLLLFISGHEPGLFKF